MFRCILGLVLITFATQISIGQTDLMFSQYIETTVGTTPKGIEVANTSGNTIDFALTPLQINQGSNGANCTQLLVINSGTLGIGEVWVIGTADVTNYALLNGTGVSGTTTYNFNFNGNDALSLFLDNVLQDQFGTCGSNPGLSWTSNGVSTADSNLEINNGICSGNINGWTDPSLRFSQVGNGQNLVGFGNAPNCVSPITADWANLQFPESGNINQCNEYLVYARVFKTGITNLSGSSPDIEAWIGFSTSNSDPSTWPSSNWVSANYNPSCNSCGNNDEYFADLGPELNSTGNFYYASRFRYEGGAYVYGGYSAGGGGFWDGSANVNGQVSVYNDQPNFANVDFPYSETINVCESIDVYAQVYEPGITEATGQGANITAWIGYNNISQTYNVINTTGWTWIEATYDSDVGNNDQYVAPIGADLPPDTYYFASRFQINCNDYSYGGIISNNIGNFWGLNSSNGIPYSGILEINNPNSAGINDVVITEIMYNSTGTDDEWIELCNVSGANQDLSFYQIDVGGNTEYTFPCGTNLASEECITVSLGDGGGTEFNIDCPFTPNFTNNLSEGTLINSGSEVITLYNSDGTINIDTVTYNIGDGANGNGSSLHIIDINLDNTTTSSNWQEVDFGGSSGVNSLIPNCLPNIADINVEGSLGNFPDIADGDNTPSFLDNTRFSSQYIGSSQSKSFRITSNGLTDIEISNISLSGDTADFIITQNPASTISYGTPSYLEISFTPQTEGTKTVVVEIANNDNVPSKQLYTFTLEGIGTCLTNSNTISPLSGPVGTTVTILGNHLENATANFNGSPISEIVNISNTEMEITIPANANTGNIELLDDNGCTSIFPFTVIDKVIGGCESNTTLLELFISEVTDATYGNLSYIELYNPTPVNVDLSDYTIRVYANGSTTNYTEQTLTGNSVNSDGTFVIATGTLGALCSPITGTYNIESTLLLGLNVGPGRDDYIGLYKDGLLIDDWGVFGDDNWMSFTSVTGDRGFNFRRLNSEINLSNDPFSLSEWNVIDWVGAGVGSCNTNDYSDIGVYDFSTGEPPTVTLQAADPFNICDQSISLSVLGQEEFIGSNSISYQWFYAEPGDLQWTEVTNNVIYNDATSNTLQILNTFGLHGVQYYCQIRDDNETCYTASEAVRLTLKRSFWNGSTWSDGWPNDSTIAVLSGDYLASGGTSFTSCQLFIESNQSLTIDLDSYVAVENHIFADGNITIETSGALVQNSEDATISGTGNMTVNKITSFLDTVFDYVYWSSPVENPLVGTVLNNSNPNRRFWFNAQNFEDRFGEANNDNSTGNPPDDIDDNGDDWTLALGSETMVTGLGYAATHLPSLYTGPGQFHYSFNGVFNTGPISVDIYRNDATLTDTNWNLIGNPYPSAISIQEFFNENAFALNPSNGAIDGALYIWSQSTPPDSNNNGNESINFSRDDYIVVNSSGAVTPNSNGVVNNGYIPSGQGFFISMSDAPGVTVLETIESVKRGEVRFTNAMRVVDNNNQFFRTFSESEEEHNKIWLNLTADYGVFCQTLISYIPGATSAFDGAIYDAKRSLAITKPAILYSIIPDSNQKFTIQGRAETDLNVSDIVPLGFETDIDQPMLYQIAIDHLEGIFMSTEPIYIRDNAMGIIHNLKESEYTFTSETGVFTDRFSIVYSNTALSKEEQALQNLNLKIISQKNDMILFHIGGPSAMKSVELYDLLGRVIYQLHANSTSETYQLPELSLGPFIAKVTLEDGRVIRSKGLKQ